MIKINTGRKRVYFSLQFQVRIYHRKQGQKTKAKIGSETMEKHCWLAHSLVHAYLPFLYSPSMPATHSGLGPHTSVTQSRQCLKDQSDLESSSTEVPSFHWSHVVSDWQKLTRTIFVLVTVLLLWRNTRTKATLTKTTITTTENHLIQALLTVLEA